MEESKKNVLITNMTSNLPTLRKRLNISQTDLGEKIGVNRSTVAAIENGKRKMTWNTFLSLVFFFTKHHETDSLLNAMEIYTDDFNEFIKN